MLTFPWRTPQNIDATFTDVDGTAITGGTVTITITKAGGTVTLEDASMTEIGSGVYRYAAEYDDAAFPTQNVRYQAVAFLNSSDDFEDVEATELLYPQRATL